MLFAFPESSIYNFEIAKGCIQDYVRMAKTFKTIKVDDYVCQFTADVYEELCEIELELGVEIIDLCGQYRIHVLTDVEMEELKKYRYGDDEEEDDYLCTACHRDYMTIGCENPCDCFCEDGEPILRKDYCQLCLVEVEKGEEYIPPSDCPHCAYPDKKWSNGCCDKCFENRLLDDDTGLCKYCTDEDESEEDDCA
jgi:hypothetical protein